MATSCAAGPGLLEPWEERQGQVLVITLGEGLALVFSHFVVIVSKEGKSVIKIWMLLCKHFLNFSYYKHLSQKLRNPFFQAGDLMIPAFFTFL